MTAEVNITISDIHCEADGDLTVTLTTANAVALRDLLAELLATELQKT